MKGHPDKMKRFVIALAILALAVPSVPARAATEYMLNFTQWSPYQRYSVAGPFETLRECMAVEAQQSFTPGGGYSCDVVFY